MCDSLCLGPSALGRTCEGSDRSWRRSPLISIRDRVLMVRIHYRVCRISCLRCARLTDEKRHLGKLVDGVG